MSVNLRWAVCTCGLENPGRLAAKLASQGVTAIEAGPRFLLESAERAKEIGAALRKEGVSLHSIHAPFRNEHDLSLPETRDQMITVVKRTLDVAADAEARIVVIHPGGYAEEDHHGERLKVTIQSLHEIVPHAEKRGVTLALENLPPGYPGNHGENLFAIAEEFNSPALGLCFDTGHAQMTGALFEHLQFMKRRIVHFHIHDNDGRRDQHLPPPFGTIHWDAFYRLFRTLDYDGALTLECSPWGDELGAGRADDSDFVKLLDQCNDLFGHLEARIRFEEEQRALDPSWRLPAMTPHRRDTTL